MKQPFMVSPNDIRQAPGNGKNAIRALLIQLEFPVWKAAKSWGYSGHFGLEEGLHANNVETFILPAWGLVQPDSHLSWLSYAKELCHNQHFDQVWLWLVHCEYPKSFLEWVATLAPVRVGCLYESLSYTREECRQNSKLETRREEVCQQMQGLTHIICSDECDAAYIQERGIAHAIWSPTFVPSRFVSNEYIPPAHSSTAFFGALYSEERRQWLEQSNLSKLLVHPDSPENATNYPLQFDRLHQASLDNFKQKVPINKEVLRQYVDALRGIRQGAFAAWMNGLRQWNGIVNLPSFGKVYTSRVAESMAAGSPAISWDVPNRPRNKALFEDGKDILLYQRNQPDQLAQHLLDLQRQPDLARTLVDNAREKIKRYHTAEVRAWQILNWIETGIEPKYGENVGGGKLGDDLATGFAQADRQDSPSNPRDVPGRSHITSEEFSGLDDPRRKPPRVSSQKFIAPVTFDGTGLVRSSENKEGLSDMSSEQLNQRNQEDQFYTELFVHSGSWSTPTPNTDETMRWGKIKVFLPEIIKHLQQVDNQPVRILDVGCGRGWLTNLLSGYAYCEGIEPVKSVVEYGRRLFPHLTLHVGFPDGLLTGDNFQPYDLIVTSEVIEHIPHAQKTEFVHTLQKLLKPNGAVILTTPRREVWEQWRTVSTPNQPIEDWITEPELFDLFQGKGFHELGRERIYFDLPKFQYVTDPTEGEDVDSSIIPLYQVWAFGIGVIFQDLHDYRGGTTSLQSFALGETSISVTKHAGSMVLSQNSEEIPPSRNPLVSVIVPTFNRPNTLKVALQSILQQTFTDYEIIVINDAGIDVEDIVASVNERNNVTSIRHGKNRGLAAARNSGLGVARGKYIAYLDDDDRFLPNHLETLVGYLEKSSYHVAYSDAWRVFEKQENEHYVEKKRDVPYSKDFNPETLLITNCFPVLCMMHEKSCLDKTGVFDESLTTHEDWDLWIRLSRHYTFAHLNEITAEFTWRMDGSSMSSNIPKDFFRTKQLIYQKYAEYFRLQPSLIPMRDQELRNLESQVNSQTFKCSIIIPVFNKVELTQQCLMYLADVTKETSYEVVIVDNHSTDGTSKFLATLGGDVQIIRNATNLGFAKACNQGAQAAKGEYVVFLNNDTIPLQGWLEPLVHEVVSNPEVAVVGSKLLYHDKTIQHAGVAFSRYNQLPYHIFNGVPENFPAVNIRKEFQAVTAACMLVRREVFEEVGGFDEAFINGFEDVDLCLKIGQIRKKVVYQPKSSLYHLESQSPGRKKHDDFNSARLATRWKHQWLVDEDIIAYQGGFIIQYNFIDEQPKVQMIPRNNVAQASSWQQVVDLQQLLIQQKRQPLAKMANSQKIRQLLVDINGWPSDIGILEWLGGVCERLDCEQEAIQCWEKILTIGDHPDARLGLARAAIKAGDLIEAQQHARLGLARAAIKEGDLIEAQQHLDVMRSAFPEQVEGFSLQGIVYMQNRKFLEASREFEHAITLNSADLKSQLGLGQAYLGLGQHLKAWEIFESGMLSGPDGLETLNGLIQAGTALENWDALATHLVRYVERNPANCDMRFALAGVEFRADHVEKAREQLTWLKLIKPDYEGLEELETLLQSAQPQGNCVSTR